MLRESYSKPVAFNENLNIIYFVLARDLHLVLTICHIYLSTLSSTKIIEPQRWKEWHMLPSHNLSSLFTYLNVLISEKLSRSISWWCWGQARLQNAANRRANQFVILHIISVGSWLTNKYHTVHIGLSLSSLTINTFSCRWNCEKSYDDLSRKAIGWPFTRWKSVCVLLAIPVTEQSWGFVTCTLTVPYYCHHSNVVTSPPWPCLHTSVIIGNLPWDHRCHGQWLIQTDIWTDLRNLCIDLHQIFPECFLRW